MRRALRTLGLWACVPPFLAGCSLDLGTAIKDAPPETQPPQPPDTLPPTGQIWEEVIIDGQCGHQTIGWVLVDEMCGALGAGDYTSRFRAPMFRDGVVIGSLLYSVDGTNLWVLDVSNPESVPRKSLTGGFGTPVSMGSHAGRLVIAAGDEGLLVVDVTDPAAPARTASLEFAGPALDVHVEGDRAVVATGTGGVAVVDLAADPPAVVQTVAVSGFAAGVVSAGDTAYVAACDSFAIVDLTKGEVVGSTWLDKAYEGEFLVAPAKDVEIDGSIAYVAAGRFGAVAIDVVQPEAPAVLGNCTVQDELSFYASGVRSEGGRLFVAGGEWGVLPIDTALGCATFLSPALPDYPDPGGEVEEERECSAEPPWEVVPWQDTWAPPLPGKDPIQVLPAGEVVYAFGDARRNALRAIDVKGAADEALPNVGRYEEPRLATGIAASGGTVVVLGKAGGVFARDEASLLVPETGAPALPADAVAVAVLSDGRWVAGTAQGDVHIQGKLVLQTKTPLWPFGLAVSGTNIAVADTAGVVYRMNSDSGESLSSSTGEKSELPPSLLWQKDGFVVAAPEWTRAVALDAQGATMDLPAHGFFDEAQILQTSLWRRGVPSRMLLQAGPGLVEVAGLGGDAGLFVHGTGGRVALPKGEYRGAAAAGERAYLVAADRSAYRSQLVTVDVAAVPPKVVSVQSFLGVGTGVAVDGDRLYVADGDKGIRVYERTGDGNVLLGIVTAPEVTP